MDEEDVEKEHSVGENDDLNQRVHLFSRMKLYSLVFGGTTFYCIVNGRISATGDTKAFFFFFVRTCTPGDTFMLYTCMY